MVPIPHFDLVFSAVFLNKNLHISHLNALVLLWSSEKSKTQGGLSTWELGTCLFRHGVPPDDKGEIQALQSFDCSPLIPLPTLKVASLLWYTVKYPVYYVNYFKNLKMVSTINLHVGGKAKPNLSMLKTGLILSLFRAVQTMWLSTEKIKIKKCFRMVSGNVDAFRGSAGPLASLNCLWAPEATGPQTKWTIETRLLIEMRLFTQTSLWIIRTKSVHIINSQVHFRRVVLSKQYQWCVDWRPPTSLSAQAGAGLIPSKGKSVCGFYRSVRINWSQPFLTSFSPNQKCFNYLSVKQSNAVPQTQLFQEIIRSTEEQTICHRNDHRSVIRRITLVTQVFLCWMTHRGKQGLELLKKEPAPWEHERRSRINCVKPTFCLTLIILRKWMEWEQMSAPVMTM